MIIGFQAANSFHSCYIQTMACIHRPKTLDKFQNSFSFWALNKILCYFFFNFINVLNWQQLFADLRSAFSSPIYCIYTLHSLPPSTWTSFRSILHNCVWTPKDSYRRALRSVELIWNDKMIWDLILKWTKLSIFFLWKYFCQFTCVLQFVYCKYSFHCVCTVWATANWNWWKIWSILCNCFFYIQFLNLTKIRFNNFSAPSSTNSRKVLRKNQILSLTWMQLLNKVNR